MAAHSIVSDSNAKSTAVISSSPAIYFVHLPLASVDCGGVRLIECATPYINGEPVSAQIIKVGQDVSERMFENPQLFI